MNNEIEEAGYKLVRCERCGFRRNITYTAIIKYKDLGRPFFCPNCEHKFVTHIVPPSRHSWHEIPRWGQMTRARPGFFVNEIRAAIKTPCRLGGKRDRYQS